MKQYSTPQTEVLFFEYENNILSFGPDNAPGTGFGDFNTIDYGFDF